MITCTAMYLYNLMDQIALSVRSGFKGLCICHIIL